MGIVERIRQDLKRDEVIEGYTKKDRFIAHDIYIKIKTAKKCYNCKNPFRKYGKFRNIVAHKIPRKYGGNNEELNLKALHKMCEKKEDAEKEKLVMEIKEKHRDEPPEKIMEFIHTEIKSKFGKC